MPESGSVTPLSLAQYAAWESGAVPGVEVVDDDTWSIPVAMPGHDMRYTICYARRGERGRIVLIDPGWASDAAWQSLQAGLSEAEITWDRVAGVVVTHQHGDHLGLAGRAREASGCWVAKAPAPRRYGLDAGLESAQRLEDEQLRAWGIPESRLADVRNSPERLRAIAALPEADVALATGDDLPLEDCGLAVLSTPGHSSDHIVLIDASRGQLFSGDHLLPRIHPHVSAEPGGLDDPLGDYLSALDALAHQPIGDVLPAHEWRFAGLHARMAQTRQYHEERLRRVASALAAGAGTAWEVAAALPRRRAWQDVNGYPLRLAVASAAACMVHLQRRGSSGPSEEGRR